MPRNQHITTYRAFLAGYNRGKISKCTKTSQSHTSAQMGNCGDLLFSVDFSQEKTTNERGSNRLTINYPKVPINS